MHLICQTKLLSLCLRRFSDWRLLSHSSCGWLDLDGLRLKVERLLVSHRLLLFRLILLLNLQILLPRHVWLLGRRLDGCDEASLGPGDHGQVELGDGVLVLVVRLLHEDALRETVRLAGLLVLWRLL